MKIIVVEAKIVWARKGKKIGRKVRCTTGRRKGRVVSAASSCSKKVDIKKRIVLRRTKARMGARIKIKAKRTKRFNPLSRRVARLNKKRR
jgi:hypothetical protein